MNILILSWRGPGHPLAGGAEQSTHEHAEAWASAGHKVTLFTSNFNKARREEVVDGVQIVRKGDDVVGVRVAAILWYLFGDHEKFDLVVDEFHGIPFFTPLYVKIKKLGWIHEVTKEVWRLNPWPKPFNLIPAIIGTIFERFIFTLFYKNIAFMTVSESTKKDLILWGIPAKNITVVYNGADLLKTKAGKEKRKTAAFLGAISKDKGIEDALETFSLINKDDPSWQFWIIGKGESDYVKKQKLKAKNLGIAGKVRFWGFVDQRKKFELLARAHILVNTSVREGWGLVNIESSYTQTPVAGYNVPGIRESVLNNKTGILVEKGEVRALSEKIIGLVNDKKRYNEFRKNCLAWSRKFSWAKSGKESLKLIESL